jgi:hypothetical protein
VPAQADGLAVDGVDAVDLDGERGVRQLLFGSVSVRCHSLTQPLKAAVAWLQVGKTYRVHEDLLGRKRRLAQRPEDEGVDLSDRSTKSSAQYFSQSSGL